MSCGSLWGNDAMPQTQNHAREGLKMKVRDLVAELIEGVEALREAREDGLPLQIIQRSAATDADSAHLTQPIRTDSD